jgi:hypothetical protein
MQYMELEIIETLGIIYGALINDKKAISWVGS